MKEVNYVFGALEERDVETLMRIGTQQQLHVSDQLLTEGSHHDAIYLVLDGELSVSVKGRETAIAYVGKGEIVGEMSLLESQPASATLCAITPVRVLRIPRDALEKNLAADPGLSLRFYRALGMLLPIAFARRSIRKRYLGTLSTQGLLFIVPTRSTPKRPCWR